MKWFKKLLTTSDKKTASNLGIETLGGVMTSIIDSGTEIPVKKARVFSTSEDNQPAVTIRVMQGTKNTVRDCSLLGECVINDIDPAPRGVPQIEIIFNINENGAVSVTAKDLSTGKRQKLHINEEKIKTSKIIDSDTERQNNENIDDEINDESGAVGTGFFINETGNIITNYHVVKGLKNKIKINFKHDEIECKLIAFDELLDLALLKAKIKNDYFIKFSNKSPKKAQSILVAGYPYGKLISDDLKITAGIINSLKGIQNNTSMIQIDATINPGNSGGPIVDKNNGTLIGVATMKLSKNFTKNVFGEASENTNYGVKSSQVRDFLEANNIKYKFSNKKLDIKELEESTVFVSGGGSE